MTKYAEAGRMNAKAEAERPPANSKTTPRSHVVRATTGIESIRRAKSHRKGLTTHGSKDDSGSYDYVTQLTEGLRLVKCFFNHFATDEHF